MYKIPFVNYKIQYENLKVEITKAINKVLENGDLILRKDVEDFEKKLASFVGTKYAVGLNSGTDALFLSLKAADIGLGDEVITVSHTFVASIAVIAQVGAKPVLIDVSDDFEMNVDKIEKAISPKTKAIMPIHLNGRMCDMAKIMKIAKKHNLIVIEDAAQALGAKFKGKSAGSFGLTGCFSFYPAKVLGASGDAGAVATDNKEVAEKIRLLRDHGQKTKTEIMCYGWNSRLDNLQAAILNIKFKYLQKWLTRRREVAKRYGKDLRAITQIKTPPSPDSNKNYFDVYQNYVVRAQKRDELFLFLKEKGIETLVKDPVPNHWQKGLKLFHFQLPNSELFAREVISLPMYPELTNKQADYVIDIIRKFYA
ncbi:MAG: DegT/DnrJ/EryC1/StrS family aminotransferase [Parcubacteria group bacterium]